MTEMTAAAESSLPGSTGALLEAVDQKRHDSDSPDNSVTEESIVAAFLDEDFLKSIPPSPSSPIKEASASALGVSSSSPPLHSPPPSAGVSIWDLVSSPIHTTNQKQYVDQRNKEMSNSLSSCDFGKLANDTIMNHHLHRVINPEKESKKEWNSTGALPRYSDDSVSLWDTIEQKDKGAVDTKSPSKSKRKKDKHDKNKKMSPEANTGKKSRRDSRRKSSTNSSSDTMALLPEKDTAKRKKKNKVAKKKSTSLSPKSGVKRKTKKSGLSLSPKPRVKKKETIAKRNTVSLSPKSKKKKATKSKHDDPDLPSSPIVSGKDSAKLIPPFVEPECPMPAEKSQSLESPQSSPKPTLDKNSSCGNVIKDSTTDDSKEPTVKSDEKTEPAVQVPAKKKSETFAAAAKKMMESLCCLQRRSRERAPLSNRNDAEPPGGGSRNDRSDDIPKST